MSSPSNEVAPPVSDATPPVPPASPPSQQPPLLRRSSVIDLTKAETAEEGEKEEPMKDKGDEQEAKRARDESFKPAAEYPRRTQIRLALGEIQLHSARLVALVANLEPEEDKHFLLEVERTFSRAFSDAFLAIDNIVTVKSK